MKRHYLLTLTTAILMNLVAPPLHAQEIKVGVVDFAKIQRHYYRTEVERKALEEKRESELKKLEAPVAEAKKLLEEQQVAQESLQDPTLSDDKKKIVLKEAQKRSGEISALQRTTLEQQNLANNQLAQEAGEAQNNLNQEIIVAIGKISEAKGLELVHNRSFGVNGVPTVAYVASSKLVDITDDVIGELNKNAPPGTSPALGAAAPKSGGAAKAK